MWRDVLMLEWPAGFRAGFCFSNDAEYLTFEGFAAIRHMIEDIMGPGRFLSTSSFVMNPNRSDPAMSFFTVDGLKSNNFDGMLQLHKEELLDGIHALGNFDLDDFRSFSMREVVSVLKNEAQFVWWSNHGSSNNKQNLGAKDLVSYQEGDVNHSGYYSLDMARSLGIKFFWLDDNVFKPNRFFGSCREIFRSRIARDGSTIQSFNRYRGLVGQPAPTLESLREQVSRDFLEQLLQSRRGVIVYQHLGIARRISTGMHEIVSSAADIPDSATEVFQDLADLSNRGLWITTTGEFLEFIHAKCSMKFSRQGSTLKIELKSLLPVRTRNVSFLSRYEIEAVVAERNTSTDSVSIPFVVTQNFDGKESLIQLKDVYV